MAEEYIFKDPNQGCWAVGAGILCLLHGILAFLLLTHFLPIFQTQRLLQLGCLAVIAAIEIAAVRTTLTGSAYKLSREGLEVYREANYVSDGQGEVFFWLLFLPFFIMWSSEKYTLRIPWDSIESVLLKKWMVFRAILVRTSENSQVGERSVQLSLEATHDELRKAVLHLAPEGHPFRDFVENGINN